MEQLRRILHIPVLLLLVLTCADAAPEDVRSWAPTPPRLSFIDGQVSFWRPGADDWASARPNLPLEPGDALYTGANSNLEVQFGSRSFVRADESTELSLVNQDEHFIQFKLTDGLVSFDIRSMAAGDSVEVDTPNAVFTIEQPGYYRVDVDTRDTHLITQHGGRATLTTADGRSMDIYPSEDIVISGDNGPQVATYAAPPPDAWDRWNEERTSRMAESVSARYIPPDVYGAEELDSYGQWRIVQEFGPVWIPNGVPADWTPYSTGSWVWDPNFEWTWVDDAPWGWAPFHYGRWVSTGGLWAWAPGPVVRRSAYCPALVSFLVRGRDVSMRAGIGLPGLSWVALSWGEPVVPWWGRPEFRGHAHWAGWGGPRMVNNVVVNRTTVINVGDIHYRNADLPRAILTAPADKFGRARFHANPVADVHQQDFTPIQGELPIRPSSVNLTGGAPAGLHPPRAIATRPVVASQAARARPLPWQNAGPRPLSEQAAPVPHFVRPPPRSDQEVNTLPRPPFGPQAGPERQPLPLPPRFGEVRSPPPRAPTAGTTGPLPERRPDSLRGTERLPIGPASPPPHAVSEPAHPAFETARPVPAPPSSKAQPADLRASRPGAIERAVRARPVEPPARDAGARDGHAQSLPGTPANQTYQRPAGEARRWNKDDRGDTH